MKKYTSRSPGLFFRSTICLFLLTLLYPASIEAQSTQYQDSLDLIGVLQNNCNSCLLEDPTSGFYWDTLAPMRIWPGVTVSNGRVTHLAAANVGLEGQLSSLSNCDQLALLDVGFNQLTSLCDLNVHSNLVMLFCQQNALTNLPGLHNTPALIFLDCSNNSLTALPDLNDCPSIQTLNCQANQLMNLPNLDSLTGLIRLSCDHNQLTLLPDLGHCPILQELNCHHNLLSELPELENCAGLRYLGCHNNQLVTLPNLDSLNLQVLNCRENKLTFFHLEPIVGGSEPAIFEYAPQDTVVIHPGDSLLMLDTEIYEMQPQHGGGASTVFQWHLDSIALSGVQSSIMPNAANGWYRCEMTNPLLPLLVLKTKPVHAYYDKGVRRHDATGDVRSDMFDLAMVALTYGESGIPRRVSFQNGCDTLLVPAYDWTDNQMNSRTFSFGPDAYNLKHADCNGDGVIDAADLNCVGNHYKPTHMPGFLQGIEQDSITAAPEPLLGYIKALDSHRVEIPYEIKMGALPQGMDSVRVRGILFSRPMLSSSHYSLNDVGVSFDYSDWVGDQSDALWMDQKYGLNTGDADPSACIGGILQPRDVGIFLKDSARILRTGDILIGDIVTIEDVFKFDNPNNIGFDSIAVKMRMYQVVLYIEDANGDIVPLVVGCETDSVMIHPDSLFAELYPPLPGGSTGPNLPGFTRNHRAIVDTSTQADPAQKNGALYQNGPNPFSDFTVIWFDVPIDMHVNFEILDPTGRVIKRFNGYYSGGRHTIRWDGKSDGGSHLVTGTYLIRMIAGEHQHVRKMVVLSQGP